MDGYLHFSLFDSRFKLVTFQIDAKTGVECLFKDIEEKSKRIASALDRMGFRNKDKLFYATHESAVLYLIHVGVWRLNGVVRGCSQDETAGA
jgi:long-subunit acyl-CoA synthetase (AMP-forming)